jgi:hypothetical protein
MNKKRASQYLVNRVPTGYNVIKCDEDFNFVEVYAVVKEQGKDRVHWFCSCPNTMAAECRHMKMISLFKDKKAIDKGMFYCYDTGEWTKVKGFQG